MRTNFKNYDAVDLLEKVESDLGINLDTSCQTTEFQLPKKIGDGAISTYLFRDGLALFLFNGTLHNDWEWEFNCEEDSPAFIFFSLNGVIEDAKKGEPGRFVLQPLHTLMVVQPGGSCRSMIFKKDEPITLAVLRIDPKKYFDNKACCPKDIPEKMRVLLSSSSAEVKCLMAPNRTTPEVIKLVGDMFACSYKGLVRTCIIEAKARQFFALVMQRMFDDMLDTGENARFANIDLQKIQQAKDVLISDLQNPPTIEELSLKVGMNRQKLKKDFKFVFEKTIYQYVVAERMEAARKIMMDQQIPILQVAEQVGYLNASHFSKRFKEFFGKLPRDFGAMIWRSGQKN